MLAQSGIFFGAITFIGAVAGFLSGQLPLLLSIVLAVGGGIFACVVFGFAALVLGAFVSVLVGFLMMLRLGCLFRFHDSIIVYEGLRQATASAERAAWPGFFEWIQTCQNCGLSRSGFGIASPVNARWSPLDANYRLLRIHK